MKKQDPKAASSHGNVAGEGAATSIPDQPAGVFNIDLDTSDVQTTDEDAQQEDILEQV